MLLNGCHEGKHTPRLSEVKCPNCGEYVLSHRVCKACGYYDGKQVLKMNNEEAK